MFVFVHFLSKEIIDIFLKRWQKSKQSDQPHCKYKQFRIIWITYNKTRNSFNKYLRVVLGFSHKSYDTFFGITSSFYYLRDYMQFDKNLDFKDRGRARFVFNWKHQNLGFLKFDLYKLNMLNINWYLKKKQIYFFFFKHDKLFFLISRKSFN